MKVNQGLGLMGCVLSTWTLMHFGGQAGEQAASRIQVQDETDPGQSSIMTLFAHDDLLSSYSFRQDAAGGRLSDGEIDLSQAQIVFSMFEEDALSFGFVGHEPVNVIDLGAVFVKGFARARDLAPKFSPSVFHTLVLDGTKVSYRGSSNRWLRLKDGQRIFDPLPKEGLYHIKPVIGHTYLMRVLPRSGGEELFKFQVVDFQPGHSVSIRWGRIPRR